MKVYAVLFLFFGVYLTVCIWIFLIITDSVRKISLHGFLRAKRNFIETVDRHFKMLSENVSVPEDEIILLCRQLKNKKMKRYFLQRFIYFADRIRDKTLIRLYFKTAFPFFKDMLQVKKNVHYSEKSYRLMLLGEFRQDLDEVNHYVMKSLDDESFDVRTNALRALSLIGNSDFFNEGLIRTCSSDKYYNRRHITDMAGSFEGSKEELKRLMLESFNDSPESYRYQVVVYMSGSPDGNTTDFILDYLKQQPGNKETVIAGLRYFRVCGYDERVKNYIWSMLTVQDTQIRAVLVKLAPVYFYKDWNMIRRLLEKEFLGSRDWYVRRNSAEALVRMGLDTEVLKKLMPVEDKYAREALIYAMFDLGLAGFEEIGKLGGEQNVHA
jgi:hypothetical protein